MKTFFRFVIICATVVLMIVGVRLFLFSSYKIVGSKMGETLKEGDYVLVNKLKNSDNPGRNRLILYTSPLRRDALNPPLLTGRCVGMPDDAVQMGADGFRVNGRLLPNMPLMQPTFRIRKDIRDDILQTMDMLKIPRRSLREDSLNIIVRLSLREKDLLLNHLSKAVNIEMIESKDPEYEFIVPRKNKPLPINDSSLKFYKNVITSETGKAAVFEDNRLFINGIETKIYRFRRDYYWILSENETEGVDSRHLGLVPADHIIGNIWYCLYGKDPDSRFQKIQ